MSAQDAPKKKLATWKIVVGVVGALVGLLILLVVGIGVFFTMNQDKLKEAGLRAKAEGAAFGANNTQKACIDKAVSKVDTSGFMEEVVNRLFLSECLNKAQPTADLCTGVPQESSILETASWRVQFCAASGKEGNQACARVLEAVQDHCHPTEKVNDAAKDSAK